MRCANLAQLRALARALSPFFACFSTGMHPAMNVIERSAPAASPFTRTARIVAMSIRFALAPVVFCLLAACSASTETEENEPVR